MRGIGAVGLEGGDLGNVGIHSLGGRQDVAKTTEVVVLVRAGSGRSARAGREDREDGNSDHGDHARAPGTSHVTQPPPDFRSTAASGASDRVSARA